MQSYSKVYLKVRLKVSITCMSCMIYLYCKIIRVESMFEGWHACFAWYRDPFMKYTLTVLYLISTCTNNPTSAIQIASFKVFPLLEFFCYEALFMKYRLCSLVIYSAQGLIPKNSISGITLYFYVEKIVFSPQRGKMSFRGGIFRIYTTFILAAL